MLLVQSLRQNIFSCHRIRRTFVTSRMALLPGEGDVPRTYTDALTLLDSLQSNSTTLTQVQRNPSLNNLTLKEMQQYLHRLGYTIEDLNALNVIHIAGTKGKGSTAAFTESILRETGVAQARPIKTGLYTSPHLINVQERIRINGAPLSEQAFTKYFFDVWDQFQKTKDQPPFSLPSFFAYLTCMAFHVFFQEKIDVTVFEVGLGGRFDPTNVVRTPLVSGITSLGMDHMHVLGETLEDIAAQKAGIMKPGVPCYTVAGQPSAALSVLRATARAVGTDLVEVPAMAEYALGLAGAHQAENASLAVQLAACAVRGARSVLAAAPGESAAGLVLATARGLSAAQWPGRCQEVVCAAQGVTYYLDGAHTEESVRACRAWVGARLLPERRHVLLLACTPPRDPQALLAYLRDLPWDVVHVTRHLDTVRVADYVQPGDQCLVTGSLHFVGSVMRQLGIHV